jgi:hypothetical protein
VSTRDDEPGDRAAREAEERAWREIVDQYGDRPDVAGLVELTTPLDEPEQHHHDEPFHLDLDDDESFTPPPLPPPPVISPERRLAWVGLVGSPVLLTLLNLLDYSVPGLLTAGLIVACIASFGYLIATMAPRDPDDDGARV